ncbi:hypothetical protein Bpfe_007749 [Biomphalaria pfeifferi]|uniref:Uncharacterized protein n=1 Tax=Biomphalaria pfeifferi TaxID=112525 RepID=A0AAD8BY54_BIOPF|nr:hypothetical protein Bpfe_007749 [Biomphalaria pfeifferi]
MDIFQVSSWQSVEKHIRTDGLANWIEYCLQWSPTVRSSEQTLYVERTEERPTNSSHPPCSYCGWRGSSQGQWLYIIETRRNPSIAQLPAFGLTDQTPSNPCGGLKREKEGQKIKNKTKCKA